MKTKSKLIALLFLLGVISISFVGCDKDDDPTPLSPAEAKAEMEMAYADLMMNMDIMMQTPGMEAMMVLMQIMELEVDLVVKAGVQHVAQPSQIIKDQFQLFGKSIAAATNTSLKDEDIPYGIYHYDFDLGDFDLVDGSVNYIELHFPANDAAYAAQQLNAVMRITELVLEEVYVDDMVEIVPSRLAMMMHVDGVQVMDLDLNLSVDNEGFPTNISMSMSMGGYDFSINYSGSNLNYNLKVNFREGNNHFLGTDLVIRLLSNRDDIDRLNGSIDLGPIRFDGTMNVAAMEDCDDVDCLNQNMDVKVIQTVNNDLIGHLEFRMRFDPEYGAEVPALVVVYSDGSYDFLDDMFGIDVDI